MHVPVLWTGSLGLLSIPYSFLAHDLDIACRGTCWAFNFLQRNEGERFSARNEKLRFFFFENTNK